MEKETGSEIIKEFLSRVEDKKGYMKSPSGTVYMKYKYYPDYGGNTSGWARHYDSPEPVKNVKVKVKVLKTKDEQKTM